MGDIHWASELPKKVRLSEPPMHRIGKEDDPTRVRTIEIDRESFERIGDYTRSDPTGPSPGRIYRKNLDWRTYTSDLWFIYYVVRDPEDDSYVYRVPYRVILVDDAPEGVPSRHRSTARSR